MPRWEHEDSCRPHLRCQGPPLTVGDESSWHAKPAHEPQQCSQLGHAQLARRGAVLQAQAWSGAGAALLTLTLYSDMEGVRLEAAAAQGRMVTEAKRHVEKGGGRAPDRGGDPRAAQASHGLEGWGPGQLGACAALTGSFQLAVPVGPSALAGTRRACIATLISAYPAYPLPLLETDLSLPEEHPFPLAALMFGGGWPFVCSHLQAHDLARPISGIHSLTTVACSVMGT